jgi:hypothetical protein
MVGDTTPRDDLTPTAGHGRAAVDHPHSRTGTDGSHHTDVHLTVTGSRERGSRPGVLKMTKHQGGNDARFGSCQTTVPAQGARQHQGTREFTPGSLQQRVRSAVDRVIAHALKAKAGASVVDP